jgi:polar amino acid transport system substrate-binding protein
VRKAFRTAFYLPLILCVLVSGWAIAQPDMTPARIQQVQSQLEDLGYSPGPVDGVLGEKTQNAILSFQKDNGLEQTGSLSESTLEHLFVDLILYTQDFDPFHYPHAATDELVGPGVELVQQACRIADLNCIVRIGEGTWEQTQQQVREGKGDGLFLIGWNAKRAEYLVKSSKILSTEYGFFLNSNDPLEYAGPESLDGYTIGVYGKSNTSVTLDKLILALRTKNVKLIKDQQPSDDPLFQKLDSGPENYAVFSNKDVGNSLSRRLGLENIRYAGRHKCVAYYVGFVKSQQEKGTVKRFNDALDEMEANGLKRSLLAPYGLGYCGDEVIAEASKPRPPAPAAEPAPKISCTEKTVDEDAIIVCEGTCLTWQKSGSQTEIDWNTAKGEFLDELNRSAFGGIKDWRLPTREELETLLTTQVDSDTRIYLDGVFDSRLTDVWTATPNTESGREDDIFYVDFYDSAVSTKNTEDTNFAKAVHGSLCP